MQILNDEIYIIKFKNKDYFNGDETIETKEAKAIVDGDKISFVIIDDYGMEKFIHNFEVIKKA
jgi:hypothetical protein